MLAALKRMEHAINEWMIVQDMLGDAEFLTIDFWRQRGEIYLEDSLLVLVIDGSPLHTLINYGGDCREFDDLVESFGFRYELGHSWSIGFYPIDDHDFSIVHGQYSVVLKDKRWKKKADLVKQVAGHKCQDCGSTSSLEAHHCYYANMRRRYQPWEYPLSAFRALCRSCHEKREAVEIRMRSFMATLSQTEMEALRISLDHAFYWFKPEAVSGFLYSIGPEERHLEKALGKLRLGRNEHE